ncbi:MAG TPA: hypothetical protein ENI23_05950 [bacterium]|nr:hypothetical protein [bacterium]
MTIRNQVKQKLLRNKLSEALDISQGDIANYLVSLNAGFPHAELVIEFYELLDGMGVGETASFMVSGQKDAYLHVTKQIEEYFEYIIPTGRHMGDTDHIINELKKLADKGMENQIGAPAGMGANAFGAPAMGGASKPQVTVDPTEPIIIF